MFQQLKGVSGSSGKYFLGDSISSLKNNGSTNIVAGMLLAFSHACCQACCCMLPACCHHIASMLFYAASMLPACCQHITSMLQKCCKVCRQACCQHFAKHNVEHLLVICKACAEECKSINQLSQTTMPKDFLVQFIYIADFSKMFYEFCCSPFQVTNLNT